MSEISREAIAYFKKRIEAEKQIINLPTCDKEVAESKKKHIAYFEQAISNMEKLQKIEEIVNLCDNPCKDCRFFGQSGKACIFLKYEEIERILEK